MGELCIEPRMNVNYERTHEVYDGNVKGKTFVSSLLPANLGDVF